MMRTQTYIYEVKSIGLSVRKNANGSKRKPQNLEHAARHNLRELHAESGSTIEKIDLTRSCLNEILIGPPSAAEVVSKADSLFAAAGIDRSSLRKDYNQGSEHVFSIHPGLDGQEFFKAMANCAKKIFGEANVLSFVIHRDQAQPHAHMLVSPISDGVYRGSKLHMAGPLKEIKEHFRSAAQTVGFEPVPSIKIKRQNLKGQAVAVVDYLESIKHPMLLDPIWPAILEMITREPSILSSHFGLNECVQPKTLASQRLIPDASQSSTNLGNTASSIRKPILPSVGINDSKSLANRSLSNEPESEGFFDSITRVRDCDLLSSHFDPITGEFVSHSEKPYEQKKAADAWVRSKLIKNS